MARLTGLMLLDMSKGGRNERPRVVVRGASAAYPYVRNMHKAPSQTQASDDGNGNGCGRQRGGQRA